MQNLADGRSAIFEVRAETVISATPDAVYATVSDLGRSGEWSTECQGGTWVEGAPGAVGSIFRGDNVRGTDVVAWAPVIRGPWTTESEVVEAEPGRVFRWSILTKDRQKQDSIWSFEITPEAGGGSRVVHHFRLAKLTEGLTKIVSGLEEGDQKRFVQEWNDKLAGDVADTLDRIRVVIEKDAGA
ncbi:SRPBCC family protein [Streptomyces luteolus]|uniref:SRPBCC family protein n=1 Tax=Streptomyces luteolus TaxID=3043615 RepID=A0ABT6T5G9_9ACTN|nr:SRPBCC family protein [Streptomyces sp. B-S-A12]MDI3422885.1 SRPBCC family protein [Streptomyces sp. B-S-A12]